MKIKLKDMTEKQYHYWHYKKCLRIKCSDCVFKNVLCASAETDCWVYHKELYSDMFLNQEIEIENEPILDAQEKAYLENLLRPFKNRVYSICKYRLNGLAYVNATKEYEILSISFKSFKGRSLIYTYQGYMQNAMQFPPFEKGLMYKKMQVNKNYTLEELGLFKDGE